MDDTETVRVWTKKRIVWVGTLLAVIVSAVLVYVFAFAAPEQNAANEQFTVPIGTTDAGAVSLLSEKGLIKSTWGFAVARMLEGGGPIVPGGYRISKAMNAWEIADVLTSGTAQKWVVIPEGLRKEEIAGILAKALGWTDAQKQEWISKDTAPDPDHTEGVYFPDTYLIPANESPADIADRMRKHFEEVFAPYAKEALTQNIKWTTALKLASIVQREAAGKSDMSLIAGILWNRLDQGMALDVDATVQYARGDTGEGWWAPISAEDKKIKSPYNTYLYPGLPPHPIDNPGLAAMKAVLQPAQTDCLYYLHDGQGNIHCAATYEEHQANIAKYLK